MVSPVIADVVSFWPCHNPSILQLSKKAMLIRSHNHKTCHSIPPTALQPAVNLPFHPPTALHPTAQPAIPSPLLHYTLQSTCHSIPPSALQPTVNPWHPIISASKMFQSTNSSSSCDTGEFWQRLLCLSLSLSLAGPNIRLRIFLSK
jgi:hypothetical protein